MHIQGESEAVTVILAQAERIPSEQEKGEHILRTFTEAFGIQTETIKKG